MNNTQEWAFGGLKETLAGGVVWYVNGQYVLYLK